MDQKFKFIGTVGYRDSYLEFLVRHFQIFRIHELLHNAAGAVRAHSGKSPENCYMIGLGQNSCLLVRVTGQLYWLNITLFLPSVFKSVDFRSSMPCIVLDIELADKSVFKELGDFFDGNVQGYSFDPPKKYKPTKQAV